MSGGQIMVLLIVAMVMFASVIKSKHGHGRRGSHSGHGSNGAAIESSEAIRLREEVTRLKERVAVLERIATDKNQLLEQEFERLRNS